jgi:tripartite-type tricarboxylate transporter receptor subunit TctC
LTDSSEPNPAEQEDIVKDQGPAHGRRRFLGGAGALASAALLPRPSAAQDAYPSKPVTIVVPFPPGGVADLTARPTAIVLEKQLRQPFVIVNRSGAGGAIGMASVAQAKPDGYTLLMALSSISIIPESERLFDRKPPYEMSQLAPIALVSADPTILVVRSESPWKSVKELVDAAKAAPGKLSYGSSGTYGTLHVAMAMFEHAAGIEMLHVPYTGAGPAITGLLGGHVDALATGPGTVIQHIKGGKLRALAGWGAKRVPSLPDLPTFRELGYDVEFYIWSGLFAPAATPAPVMKTLRDAMRTVAQDAEFRATMEKMETPIAYLDAPEFQKFWDRDAKMLADALKRIGRVEDVAPRDAKK